MIFLTFQTHSAEKELGRFFIGAGLSGNQFTVSKDDVEVAKMYLDGRPVIPVVGYRVLPRPFIDAWGIRVLRWSIELEGTTFKANRQVVEDNRITDLSGENNNNDGDELDLGTEVKGNVLYLTPAIHLYFELTDSLHAYFGFGAGIGHANISGDYYITDTTVAGSSCLASTTFGQLQSNCERRQVDFHKTGLATTAFSGAIWGPLGIRYSRGGPVFTDSGFKHKADIEMFSAHLMWAF